MRTIRLTIAYDGTEFSGFQAQPGRRTVQETIETAVQRITGSGARVAGAGRTDSGVHASGQIVSFETESTVPIEDLARALDAILPADVGIIDAAEADPEFHARFSARGRGYRYTIANTTERPVLDRRFVYHWRSRLDETRMDDAAQEFAGEHDFVAFCGSLRGRARQTSTVRTIFRIQCWRNEERVMIEAAADGFLPRMVRNLAGTLIRAGMNQLSATDIRDMLSGHTARVPTVTAPALGLCLTKVWYD